MAFVQGPENNFKAPWAGQQSNIVLTKFGGPSTQK